MKRAHDPKAAPSETASFFGTLQYRAFPPFAPTSYSETTAEFFSEKEKAILASLLNIPLFEIEDHHLQQVLANFSPAMLILLVEEKREDLLVLILATKPIKLADQMAAFYLAIQNGDTLCTQIFVGHFRYAQISALAIPENLSNLNEACILAVSHNQSACLRLILNALSYLISHETRIAAIRKAARKGFTQCLEIMLEDQQEEISTLEYVNILEKAAKNGHLACLKALKRHREEFSIAYSVGSISRLIEVTTKNGHTDCAAFLRSLIPSPQVSPQLGPNILYGYRRLEDRVLFLSPSLSNHILLDF